MRRWISWVLLIGTLSVIGFWRAIPTGAQEDEAPRCNCYYPNTGRYGVIRWGDCRVVDCWIILE